MRELESPDRHYLNAASGWLDLGNSREARGELERVGVLGQAHPEVLELRWRLEAEDKRWAESLLAAEKLIGVDPENPSGWIHRSYSLHELKRTREARELLLKVVEKFGAIPIIPYNLACYACQLGDLTEARQWLTRAEQLLGKERLREMAAQDADLLPLRGELTG
jgi:tetratricopeptide (TPR) repeat protein